MRPEEMIGQVLGHYKIVRPLGVGGTAMVFVAQDINLHRDVALKLFQPQEGETRDFLRRFAREARVVAQLDHTNILPVYDYGEQDGMAYLVMPQMMGSLRERLAEKRIFSPNEMLRVIGPILNALQYAHDRGLIHRDIKPGNILFKADGTPMLADFGLVKVLTPSTEQTLTMNQTADMTGHVIAGTPDYMSPEQINGTVTPASDIYSIGIVLYEMLTGTRPFSADTYMGVLMKQVYEPPRSLRSINPHISAAVENVVLHALDKDGTRRYQRPDELRQALESAIGGTRPYNASSMPISYATDPMPTVKQDVETESTVSAQDVSWFPPSPSMVDVSRSTPVYPATQQTPLTSNVQSNEYAYHQQQAPPVSSTPLPYTSYPEQRRRRMPVPLLIGLIVLVLLLIGGVGTAFFAPPPFGVLNTGHTKPPVITTPRPKATTIVKGSTSPTVTPGTTPVTLPVPATTTDCPATGTARAEITAPLVPGSHRNIIYIVNESSNGVATFGTLKRRDVDSNLQATEIKKMAGTSISEAQVSQDGQWVLFVAHYNAQDQLRLVRADGQGLQTLYCASQNALIRGSQWSFNQHFVVFDAGTTTFTTYLLDITTGNVQPELVPQGNANYIPNTWLDSTHIYLTGFNSSNNAPRQGLYLLDIQRGMNQHDTDLKQVATFSQPCDSFDTSYDLTHLFLSSCTASQAQGFSGPSAITAQPVTGGSSQSIYSNTAQAVTMIRAVTPTTLLFMIETSKNDTTQNGLWEINTDGTGLTRLSTDTDGSQALCPYSQYAWSNVSRDGTLYALESYNQQTNTYGMYYGSLSGSAPTQFAGITGTQLFLVGWTTM